VQWSQAVEVREPGHHDGYDEDDEHEHDEHDHEH